MIDYYFMPHLPWGVKQGVNLSLSQDMLRGLYAINGAWDAYFAEAVQAYPLIVTSGRDGDHSESSRHYTGDAVDIRTRHLDETVKEKLVEVIQKFCGSDFWVLLEPTHIHIEYRGHRTGLR